MKIQNIHEVQRTKIKVWLDDVRPAPEGWSHVYWPEEAIELLKGGNVVEISLDHDLGDDDHGTGYDVLLWIEEEIHVNPDFLVPVIHVHSANPVAQKKMNQAITSIHNIGRWEI